MLSPLLTDVITEVLISLPKFYFWFCFILSSLAFEYTSSSFDVLEASIGFIVLLNFLLTDDSSDIPGAFLFSNTGFFNKLRTVLITRSAVEAPLSVSLE